MVDAAVKKFVCEACGADVRDESLFCYNCGEAVTEAPVEDDPAVTVLSDTVAKPTPAAAETNGLQAAFEKARIQTDSGIRKRSKPFQRKRIEVVWEPRMWPTTSFIVAVAVLTLITILLLFAALYLR